MKQSLAIVLSLLVYCISGVLSPVHAQSNVLANGGFESGTGSWSWYKGEGTAEFDAPSPGYAGTYKGRISMGADMEENVQLYQYGMSIKADTVYTLAFTAYSSTGGSVLVQLLKHTSPYSTYGLYQEVTLGTGWQTYQFNFTTSGFSGTTTDVRFRFWFPGYSSDGETVYLDEISLSKAATATPPLAPLLAYPDSGATGVTANPTLSWNASGGATSYEIQVARTSAFGSTIVSSQTGITDTWCDVGGLGNDTTYYWHVRATNSAGTSSWSNTWRFTVHVDPPQAPVLNTPANQATNIPRNPSFAWQASGGATSYQLQVSLFANFSVLALDEPGVTETSFDASPLSSDTVYYWRVRASNAGGNSSWSATWSFRTAETGEMVNILTNGSFESGTDGWSWWDPDIIHFSVGDPVPGGGLAGGLVTFDPIPEYPNLQLYQTGITLAPNTNYTIRFHGYSNSGHNVGVYLQKHTAPYTDYGLWWTPELTTTWQEFDMTFDTPAFFDPPEDTASTTDTRLRFWFADDAADGDVYHLDSVSLCRTSAETTQPLLQAVAVVAGGREAINDDELVLLDASWSTGSIGSYYWSVDGTELGREETLDRYLPLGANERSKLVTVSLVVFDTDGVPQSESQVVIRVTRRPKAYFYLTDHLGTIRSTVSGGKIMVQDDFTANLSKWDVAAGIGWSYGSGYLGNQAMGLQENILINRCPTMFTEGSVSADVMSVSSASYCGALIVRYQNTSNFYLVKPEGSYVKIFEKVNGTFYLRATSTTPLPITTGSIQLDTWYPLKVVAEGPTLIVYLNDAEVLRWTDTSPWNSGKVGFWLKGPVDGTPEVRWKNMYVTTDSPGRVVTAEDFDPWGLVLDGRSYVDGTPDQRYKFTGKERDAESGDATNQGYDYFGARYYDSRIARWMSVDPLAEKYPTTSPFAYTLNNPVALVDPDGRYSMRSFERPSGTSQTFFYREGYVAAFLANAIPGGSFYRFIRQDPALGIPSFPGMVGDMALDIFGSRIAVRLGGRALEFAADWGGVAAAFFDEDIFEAQMIEQEAFRLLKDRDMLVGGTPRLDNQGRLVSIDDAEGTDVMYANPKWLAKEGISAEKGNELIVKTIEGVWLRKNPALYLRLIKGQTDADRIRLRRLAGRIDASAAAPADHTYTSPD